MALSIREAIDRANAVLVEAFASALPEELARSYTDTSVLLPPSEPQISGTHALVDRWRRMFQDGQQSLELNTTSVEQVSDEVVLEIGTYRKTVVSTATGEEAFGGHYLAVWRQIDSEWRIAVDIWNTQ